jgi:hypothetical protein
MKTPDWKTTNAIRKRNSRKRQQEKQPKKNPPKPAPEPRWTPIKDGH